MPTTLDRRDFIRAGLAGGATLAGGGALRALWAQEALGHPRPPAVGYGPLVDKGDLALPADFDYVILDRQGTPLRDGSPTPGIFDGMGSYRGRTGETILIRNHENRERPGEQKVLVGEPYAANAFGGNTKVVVRRNHRGIPQRAESFAVLGGTSTNCAGGVMPWEAWVTCEEVVKRTDGTPHGYSFEIPAHTDRAVPARPIIGAGRFSHEACAWYGRSLYQTEDRDTAAGGACLYRYTPEDRSVVRRGGLAGTSGMLEALAIAGEPRANMDAGRYVGKPYPVEWVPVPEPDHGDDTDMRRDRVPGFTPVRFQAQDNGAAIFDREEGMWVGGGIVYFDCTSGGPAGLGQLWAYDPRRETVTLIYESTSPESLQAPDNVVAVPKTGDLLLQEDGPDEQFVRGVTTEGEIYDFARAIRSGSEFCGGCFDPAGDILYLNQQGDRGSLPGGPDPDFAVTYAIFGPFKRRGRR